MDPLDENYGATYVEVSPFPTIIRYGLIGGGLYILINLIAYLTGIGTGELGFGAAMLYSVLTFAIAIGLLVMAIKKHRDTHQGGYITLGKSIMIGTLVTLLSMLISSIFQYIYVTVIDPNLIDRTINSMVSMMENMGNMPEESLEQMVVEMRNQYSLPGIVKSLLSTIVVGLIVSAIAGLIMKRDRPRV